MAKEKHEIDINPKMVDMSILKKYLKTKDNIASFFNIKKSSVSEWAEKNENYVPLGRKYEFASRFNEIDNFVKN